MVDGRKIRELRENESLSTLELAERLGISQPYMSQVETGFKQPGFELVERIADYFEVTTDYFRIKESIATR